MPIVDARITEIQLDLQGHTAVWIHCPETALPASGQYCLAEEPGDPQAVLPTALMMGEVRRGEFLALPLAGSLPASWTPGASLYLRSPLGKGFSLPASLGRLALVACEESIARLAPLAALAASRGVDISWFTDVPVPSLPAAYELSPLNLVSEALRWADFIAIEIRLSRLAHLRGLLGLPSGQSLPCPAQVLILTPMPCAGQAECGACAVPSKRGWKLACTEGPVFDLNQLEW